jgi:hypothetical protein
MEEIQLFLTQDPKGNKELIDATLIQFALIKLSKTGLYSKAIEAAIQKIQLIESHGLTSRATSSSSTSVCSKKQRDRHSDRRATEPHQCSKDR